MSKVVKRSSPACVNCQFHTHVVKGNLKWDRCSAPVWDFVQGKEVARDELCYEMRAMNAECGNAGRLFEARDEA